MKNLKNVLLSILTGFISATFAICFLPKPILSLGLYEHTDIICLTVAFIMVSIPLVAVAREIILEANEPKPKEKTPEERVQDFIDNIDTLQQCALDYLKVIEEINSIQTTQQDKQ